MYAELGKVPEDGGIQPWRHAARHLRDKLMKDSRKTRLVLVLTANLLLSLTVGYGIWRAKTTPTSTAALAAKPQDAENAAERKIAALENKIALLESKNAETAIKPAEASAKDAGSNPPAARKSASSRAAARPQLDSFVPPPPVIEGYAPRETSARPISTSNAVSRPRPRYRQTAQSKFAGVKLTGVIGNKAILLMRKEGMQESESPEAVCLAPGERVTTINNVPISIIDVQPKKVVMEVGGDRLEKLLPDIR